MQYSITRLSSRAVNRDTAHTIHIHMFVHRHASEPGGGRGLGGCSTPALKEEGKIFLGLVASVRGLRQIKLTFAIIYTTSATTCREETVSLFKE